MIDPWVYLLGALLLLVLPLKWLLAAMIAAAIHELCHLGAIYILGGQVLSFRIGPAGAVLETDLYGRGREAAAALAGPAGSCLLLFFLRICPCIAICGAVQGLFNLLPLYPLDGGRVLRCALEGRLTEGGFRTLEGILSILAALAVARWSVIFALVLILRGFLGKISCKRRATGVQ